MARRRKNKKMANEESNQTQAETVEQNDQSTEGLEEEQQSEEQQVEGDELETLQAQHQELNDRFLRLFSEFDNFKKRTARERLELMSSAKGDSLRSLLPIIDDFERAMQNNDSVEDVTALREGFHLIHGKMKGILESNGLKPMNTEKGDAFDTDIHEAITQIPAPEDSLKGKVVDVIEKGYTLNEKVIRYAKVVIGS